VTRPFKIAEHASHGVSAIAELRRVSKNGAKLFVCYASPSYILRHSRNTFTIARPANVKKTSSALLLQFRIRGWPNWSDTTAQPHRDWSMALRRTRVSSVSRVLAVSESPASYWLTIDGQVYRGRWKLTKA